MNIQSLRAYFLLALIIGSFVLALYVLEPFLTPLIFAVVAATLLHPLHVRLTRRLKGRQSLAALTLVVMGICLVLILFISLGASVADDARNIMEAVQKGRALELMYTIQSEAPYAAEYLAPLVETMGAWTGTALAWGAGHIGSFVAGLASAAFSLLIFFISLFYLLRDGERFVEAVNAMSPLDTKTDAVVLSRFSESIDGIVRGNFVIAFMQGVAAAVGYLLFDVSNAFFWGIVTAISSLLPVVGPAFVFVPIALFVFLDRGLAPALGIIIYGSIVAFVIANVIGPRIVGGRVGLHPLLVLLSVLGGINFFGFIGILLGPLILVLLSTFLKLYMEVWKEHDPQRAVH